MYHSLQNKKMDKIQVQFHTKWKLHRTNWKLVHQLPMKAHNTTFYPHSFYNFRYKIFQQTAGVHFTQSLIRTFGQDSLVGIATPLGCMSWDQLPVGGADFPHPSVDWPWGPFSPLPLGNGSLYLR